MKKLFLLTTVCAALFMSSCSTITKTATTAMVESTVVTYPEVADLEIQQKASQTMTWNFRPFHLGEPSKQVAQGNLVAQLLKANNADVLLEPQFVFERTSYGERVLTVTGFPATYKNFRKASAADLEAIKACKKPNEKKIYNDPDGGGLFKVFMK